jgi:hypothetical protein
MWAGQSWNSLGVDSNGYLVVGGGDTVLDNSFTNTSFPNPARPNNVLAPFWTDLNPGATGAVRMGTLTDGSNTWIVVDWQNVPEFVTNSAYSFQAWIGIDSDAAPGEDISFVHGPLSALPSNLTVGARRHHRYRGRDLYGNASRPRCMLIIGLAGSAFAAKK